MHCTISGRYRLANRLEMSVRDLFYKMGMRYWENCLLAVFQKD